MCDYYLDTFTLSASKTCQSHYHSAFLWPGRQCFWRKWGWAEGQRERPPSMSFTIWWQEWKVHSGLEHITVFNNTQYKPTKTKIEICCNKTSLLPCSTLDLITSSGYDSFFVLHPWLSSRNELHLNHFAENNAFRIAPQTKASPSLFVSCLCHHNRVGNRQQCLHFNAGVVARACVEIMKQ